MIPAYNKLDPTVIAPGDYIIACCVPVHGFPIGEYRFIIERAIPTSPRFKLELGDPNPSTFVVYLPTNSNTARIWMNITMLSYPLHGYCHIGLDKHPVPCRHYVNPQTRGLGDLIVDEIWLGRIKLKAQRCNPGDCVVKDCTRTLAYPIGKGALICWLHAMELFPQLTPKLEIETLGEEEK